MFRTLCPGFFLYVGSAFVISVWKHRASRYFWKSWLRETSSLSLRFPSREGNLNDRLDVSLNQDFQKYLEALCFQTEITNALPTYKKKPGHRVLNMDPRSLEREGQPSRHS